MRRISISAIVGVACILAATTSVVAQDLGEAARQERERKTNLTRHATVITNDDLSREKIVSPQPEIPVVATAPAPSAPAPAIVAPQPSATRVAVQPVHPAPGEPGFSLGEYARKVREEKATRLAKEQELERQAADAAVVASAPQQEVQPAPVRSQRAAAALPPRSLQPAKIVAPPAVVTKRDKQVAKHDAQVTKREAQVVTKNVSTGAVEVRRGDSLWRISRRHLGHGHLWQLVWKSNPQIANPAIIRIGQTLDLPSAEVVAAALAKEAETRLANARTSTRPQMVTRVSAPKTIETASRAGQDGKSQQMRVPSTVDSGTLPAISSTKVVRNDTQTASSPAFTAVAVAPDRSSRRP
jgi:nucleoid-associated protein YgaU